MDNQHNLQAPEARETQPEDPEAEGNERDAGISPRQAVDHHPMRDIPNQHSDEDEEPRTDAAQNYHGIDDPAL